MGILWLLQLIGESENKVFAAACFVVVFSIASCLLVPATLTTLAAGVMFRPFPVALFLVLLASQFSLLLALVLGKSALKPCILSYAHSPTFSSLDAAFKREAFKLVVLIRLSPVVPFGIANYLFSLTSIPLHTLLIATVIGNIPGAVTYTFLGSLISDLSGITDSPIVHLAPKTRAFLALSVLSIMIWSAVYIGIVAKGALRIAASKNDNEVVPAFVLNEISSSMESVTNTGIHAPAVTRNNSRQKSNIVDLESQNDLKGSQSQLTPRTSSIISGNNLQSPPVPDIPDSNVPLLGNRLFDDSDFDARGYTVSDIKLLQNMTRGVIAVFIAGIKGPGNNNNSKNKMALYAFKHPFFRDIDNFNSLINFDGDEKSKPWGKNVYDANLDLTETEKSYVVHADLPGIKKEDVNVTYKDNVLTISGERKFNNEIKDDHRHIIERSHGKFTRSVRLPVDTNGDEVSAKMEHGVLELTFGKKAKLNEKKIAIN